MAEKWLVSIEDRVDRDLVFAELLLVFERVTYRNYIRVDLFFGADLAFNDVLFLDDERPLVSPMLQLRRV